MANKKAAPDDALRQGGRQTEIKLTDALNYAGTARESQPLSCADCAFYREIPLPSGRRRRLCTLSGEKLRTAGRTCPHFQPGNEEGILAAFGRARQGLVCRACSRALVPTIRAALLGLVGCMAGHVVAGAAWPAFCADFRARRAADAR